MKKIMLIVIVLCITIGSSFAQKSTSFKGIKNLYEKEVDLFFINVFAVQKTGIEMDTTLRKKMEVKIYDAFITDFYLWAKWTKKYHGEKPFELKLKGTKEDETESTEYLKQFKLIQANFVKDRLIWTEEELKKVLTQEKLQAYINPVVEKFVEKTIKMLNNINK